MKKYIFDFQKSFKVDLDLKYSGSNVFLATKQLVWRLLILYVFIGQGIAYAVADTGLWVSQSPNRSNPVLLEGQVIQGNTYIFLESDQAVSQVIFNLSNGYTKKDRRKPFDLAGRGRKAARPFDTSQLADGQYVLDARTSFSSGAELVYQATFTVANDAPAPSGILTPSSSNLNFRDTPVNDRTTQTVMLTNSGTAPINNMDVVVTGDAFRSTSNTCGSMGIGANCVVSLEFSPSTAGTYDGVLTVSSDAENSPLIVNLSGTGTIQTLDMTLAWDPNTDEVLGYQVYSGEDTSNINTLMDDLSMADINPQAPSFNMAVEDNGLQICFGVRAYNDAGLSSLSNIVCMNSEEPTHNGILTVSSLSLEFGEQLVGTTSGAQPLTLTNDGTAPINIASIDVTGDFLWESNNCTSLAVGASCSGSVSFNPTSVGNLSGLLTVNSDADPSSVQTNLTGTGTEPHVGILTVPSSNVDFGEMLVGNVSVTQTVVLTNSGTAPINNMDVVVTGDAFRSTSNTCGSMGIGENCVVSLEFSPSTAGTYDGVLTVSSDAENSPLIVNLTGTGTIQMLDITLTWDPNVDEVFGYQVFSGESTTNIITLMDDLSMADINPQAPSYNMAVEDNGLQKCFGVRAYNDAGLSDLSNIVCMNSEEPAPKGILTVSSSSVNFETLVNSSTTQMVMFTNNGTAPVNNMDVIVTGDAFRSTSSTCGSLDVGGSCIVYLEYSPTTAGTHDGNLTVSSDAENSPLVVNLTGTSVILLIDMTLTWDPNADEVLGYQVYSGDDTSNIDILMDDLLLTEIDPQTPSFNMVVQDNGVQMCYGVRAYNDAGLSDLSNIVCVN